MQILCSIIVVGVVRSSEIVFCLIFFNIVCGNYPMILISTISIAIRNFKHIISLNLIMKSGQNNKCSHFNFINLFNILLTMFNQIKYLNFSGTA